MNKSYKIVVFLLYFGALQAMEMGDIEDGNLKFNFLEMRKDFLASEESSSFPIIQTTLKANDKLMRKEFEKQCKDQQVIATQKYCPLYWNQKQDTWYGWICEGCWEGIVTVCCYSYCLKNRKN